MIKNLFVILITTMNFCAFLSAQSGDLTMTCDCSNDSLIRTILFFKKGWDLSPPVVNYQQNEKLDLEFDYLGQDQPEYSYSIANCTYDWKLSNASEQDYLDGFNNVPIYNRDFSVNTQKSYIHYSVMVPGDDLKINQSGNYIIKVFDQDDPDKIIFTRRFCLFENLTKVTGSVYRPDDEHQEIHLQVDLENLQLANPMGEIKIVVIKNYDWNNVIKITSPPMLQDNKLVYDMPDQISIGGGNEFRYFNSKNTKFVSERIDKINYKAPYFHFYLKPDESRGYSPYFSSTDIDGRYYIDASDANDRYLDADYVYVHFTLKTPQPFDSEVYIYGALTGYKADKSDRMNYNVDKGIYQGTLFLKQGYYNYDYVLKDYKQKDLSSDLTEGNHAETENDYQVFVYLKTPDSDFDRLVGYTIINSVRKTEQTIENTNDNLKKILEKVMQQKVNTNN